MKAVSMYLRWALGTLALGLACGAAWAVEDRELERALSLFLRAKGLATNPLHERGSLSLTTKAAPAVAVAPAAAGRPAVLAVGVVVRIAGPDTPADVEALARLVQDSTAHQLAYRGPLGLGLHVFRLRGSRPAAEVERLAALVRTLPGVALADPDLLWQPRAEGSGPESPLLVPDLPADLAALQALAAAGVAPNDSYFNLQAALLPQHQLGGGIDAVAAWGITQGARATVVAVLDTGVLPHPEFADRLLPGFDAVSDLFLSNDGDGRDSDASDPGNWVTEAEAQEHGCAAMPSNWHGTGVTGILAARGGNGAGIAGVNWNTRILPVRVTGKCGGASSDVIAGMLFAAGIEEPGRVPPNPTPAQVINMSLGVHSTWGCSPTFAAAVDAVRARDVLIVAAAGNDNEEATDFLPAACPGVLTVTATDKYGFRAAYSNVTLYGKVAVAAPGGDGTLGDAGWLVTTSNEGQQGPTRDSYRYVQGTSYATPHVSGVAALALAVNPELSADLLAALILVTSHEFQPTSVCTTLWPACGAGILHAADMVKAAAMLQPYAVVHEFYNPQTDRYFRTADKTAPAILRTGAIGPWTATRDYFIAWRQAQPDTVPVCRFYSGRYRAHYYTGVAQECEALRANPDWTYENVAFHARLPSAGICSGATVPVQRWFSTATGDFNFRFIREPDYGTILGGRGWSYAGVAFCVEG